MAILYINRNRLRNTASAGYQEAHFLKFQHSKRDDRKIGRFSDFSDLLNAEGTIFPVQNKAGFQTDILILVHM